MFNLSRLIRKRPGAPSLALPLRPRRSIARVELPGWAKYQTKGGIVPTGGGLLRRWAPLQDDAAPSGGFLSSISAALGGLVSQVAPIYTASLAQKAAAQAQQSTLKAQANLYTPQNIQTLYNQQQFEAAQRGIQAGRDTGSVSTSIPWVPLALGGGALLVAYLVMKK